MQSEYHFLDWLWIPIELKLKARVLHGGVKPWLSKLDVPEWPELAGDRLGWGWRKMLKSIKIRTYLVLQVRDRRWIERKMPR
jgi:hypothetical protein